MGSLVKHTLVTGGAGYIGSVLVPLLLKENRAVTVLDTAEPAGDAPEGLRHPALQVICGDVKDPKIVERALRGIDSVIYLAGVSDGRAGKADPALTRAVNVDAFRDFVAHAKKSSCNRMVFASTFGVYGYAYDRPLTESLEPDPQEPYSASKLAGELLLQESNAPSFVTTSLRLAMVCGSAPRMRPEFLVNRLVADAHEKKHLKIAGGGQIRPQIHILDVCRYLVKMLDLPPATMAGQVFNACGFNKSISEIAGEIQAYYGPELEITCLPYRKGEHTFTLDQSKLQNATGLSPRYGLTDAVKEIAEGLCARTTKIHAVL